VPDPADTTTYSSTTTANATDATQAPTFQVLFTQNTYLEEHKCHCRRNLAVGGAKFHAEPDGVRYHPRTLWGTISTSLAESLSQSLSASMVEQARLFNLLVEYVNQDQPQASDSILPLFNYQWTLEKKRGQVRATSEYYLR
jgi:hypothetical protein